MENRKGVERNATGQRRKNWSPDEAKKVLGELAASGESVRGFARHRGLAPQRLWWWQKRLEEAGRGEATAEGTFLPVTVRAVEREAAAALELGHGLRVNVHQLDETSAAWVASLVRALGAVR